MSWKKKKTQNKSSYSHQAEQRAAPWRGRQARGYRRTSPTPLRGGPFPPRCELPGPHGSGRQPARLPARPPLRSQQSRAWGCISNRLRGGGREGANYCHPYWCSEEYQRVINGISIENEGGAGESGWFRSTLKAQTRSLAVRVTLIKIVSYRGNITTLHPLLVWGGETKVDQKRWGRTCSLTDMVELAAEHVGATVVSLLSNSFVTERIMSKLTKISNI